MKIISTIKYQLIDAKRSLFVFFGSLILALALISVSATGSAQISGFEMVSVIFIFVMGLNSFKSAFYFSLANGVSRKTQFISFIASTAIVSMILILVNSILYLIFSNFIPYISLYAQLYFRDSPFSFTDNIWSGMLWSFLLFFMAAVLGYMICLIYYRSGLILKLIVSIAPPAFLFIVLPFMARLYPQAAQYWLSLAGNALGVYPTANPYHGMLTFLTCSILFSAAGYLLIRHAPIKK